MADHVIQTFGKVTENASQKKKIMQLLIYFFAILVISLDWGYKANPPDILLVAHSSLFSLSHK